MEYENPGILMRLESLFEFEGAYTEDVAWLEGDAGPTAWIAKAEADVKGTSLNGRMRWTNEARPSHGATWTSHNIGLLEIAGGELIRVNPKRRKKRGPPQHRRPRLHHLQRLHLSQHAAASSRPRSGFE